MASINAPMQIRYYTTERAVNRRGRKGRREVQTKEILKVFLGVLGVLGGETVRRLPGAARKLQADAAFVWDHACGREADEFVPANPPAHTCFAPGRRRPAMRDRRPEPCWK